MIMLAVLEILALNAGKAILEVYHDGATVTLKSDASPVTEADERAEAIILAGLAKAYPDIPVVAEESVAAGRIPDVSGGRFFLVDPLDGTKEFINRRDDFTVNIALIENGVPVAGIVYAPAKGSAYTGQHGHAEKFSVGPAFTISDRSIIHCRKPMEAMTAVASRSHNSPETEAFLLERGITNTRSVGSSLKFCLLAEGLADVYPRFGRTMEWDTAAGDAVLRAAGGITVDLDDRPFLYGKTNQPTDSDFANGHFIAWGSQPQG
jgi:3'(2'), 5'-bisphosphate nucleotidase